MEHCKSGRAGVEEGKVIEPCCKKNNEDVKGHLTDAEIIEILQRQVDVMSNHHQRTFHTMHERLKDLVEQSQKAHRIYFLCGCSFGFLIRSVIFHFMGS